MRASRRHRHHHDCAAAMLLASGSRNTAFLTMQFSESRSANDSRSCVVRKCSVILDPVQS